MIRFALLCFFSLWLGGCGLFSGVSVKAATPNTSPPSKVIVPLSVSDSGRPVDYLDESNFTLSESGIVLDSQDVGLRLLPRETNAVGHTVLLVDVSGAADAQELAKIERGAAHFLEKATSTQAVTVLAFDGGATVRRVGAYPRVESPVELALPPLAGFASGDDSRDLNGAVLEALSVLKSELESSDKPIRLGTLVVHARGPDLAGRKSDADVNAALDEVAFDTFLLAPEQAEIPTLGELGRNGAFRYVTADDLPLRFQDLGMLVRKSFRRHYLISYCSPARAGTRELSIRVQFIDEDGGEKSGSSSAEFSAEGFTGGCKPSVTPAAPVVEEPTSAPEPAADPTPVPTETAPPKKKKPAVVKKKSDPEPAPAPAPAASDEDVVAPPSSGKYK